MVIPVFRCRVEKGRIIMENSIFDTWQGYVRTLKDGFYNLSVKKPSEKNQRSNQQNRYYFGVVVNIISEETGYTADEIHELLKVKFLKRWVYIKDKEYISIKSTTELSTSDWEDYMEQIRTWASMELGIYIPEPKEIENE